MSDQLSQHTAWLRAKLDEAQKSGAPSISFPVADAVRLADWIENLERRCDMLAEHINRNSK